MTFQEYATSERERYERLAEIVELILRAAIGARSDLRLQHTQKRAKAADSLQRKLKRDGHFEAADIENHAKDLGGCRLVFYTNSDVSAFLSSRIIADNFEVDWDRTKIHHPKSGSDDVAEQFVSNNYVVRLKEDRAALPEYSAVAGLWCEVQVQTTLNHAWAEMAHDTIYKKPELPGGFGASLMRQIEERMRDIMRQHLLPAGYEFQKVLTDFERLSAGKKLFDRGSIKAILECDDNNARFELLQRFSEYVLPHYDDIQDVALDIRVALREAVKMSRADATTPIETPFGNLPGHSSADVIGQVAGIIDRVRYVDVERTFEFLIEMFSSASDEEERSRWTKSAEELARHEIPAWEKVGPAIQLTLLSLTKRLPKHLKESARPLLLATLRKVLETEVTGTTADFDKVIFSRGTIPFSDAVQRMRREAIRLLKLFFLTAQSDQGRRAALAALHEGTRLVNSTDERFEIAVVENSRDLVEFYRRFSDRVSYDTLESLEHKALWLYRHTPRSSGSGNADLDRVREELRGSITAFRDQINSDDDFVIYKTLVGYESVFEPAWDDDEFDIQGIDRYRSERIDELVATIAAHNVDRWLGLIRTCASTESGDLATFPKFGEFLEKLAVSKPEIAFSFLTQETELLHNFLPSIARGLESTSRYPELSALMCQWATKGKYLSSIVWTFRSTKGVDVEVLKRALRQAIVVDDRHALLNLLTVADLRNSDVEGGLVDAILMPTLKTLAERGEHGWPNVVSGGKPTSAFSDLSPGQADEVLNALLQVPRFNWHLEAILSTIALNHPRKVIDHFGKRIDLKSDSLPGYDPVPMQFYGLHEHLVRESAYAIDAARKWFVADPLLFSYRGGRFVANIFSGAWGLLEAELRKFVSGQDSDVEFVVQVLRTFEGEDFLHPLIRDVVNELESGSDLFNELEIALDQSGVVTGEFGFVALYQQRRESMKEWLKDDRPRVREFAERHIRSLDRMIAAEQRRAEEGYELRKRNWSSGQTPSDEEKKK